MQPTSIETAEVWRGERLAGRIRRTRDGSVFESVSGERFPVGPAGVAFTIGSQGVPVATRGVNLHPFFAGLLPEGIRLQSLTRRVKTSSDDLLSLLIAAGADTVGDVAVVPEGTEPLPAAPLLDVRRAGASDFNEILASSLESSETTPLDATVPGVQEKISAAMISIPVRSRSRHAAYLLKLNPADRPLLVENECFFMHLAAACGLRPAETRLVHDRKGKAGLLVKRFDRVFARGAARPVKAHQEDACQFLDRYPADKYRIPASEIVEGMRQFASAPLVEILRFIELYAYSYLIGNGDLHAKNVSLLSSPETGLTTLSPVYDVLSTLAYPGLDQRMALKLDGRDDAFRKKDFIAFGERQGIPAAATAGMLDRLVRRAGPGLNRLGAVPWPDKTRRRIEKEIKGRLDRLK